MPQDFLDCVANKGKIITRKLKDGKYQHVCFDSKGEHKGEVKTKQSHYKK